MLTEKQIHDEYILLERLQQDWLLGKSSTLASHDLPHSWQPLLNALPSEQKAISALALASQFQHLLYIPKKPKQLNVLPTIPLLSKPTLPDELRPAFCRLIETINNSGIPIKNILRLLSLKGFTPNPADWLPSKNDNALPRIYTPWTQWIENKKSTYIEDESSVLTQENWDEWYPAQRLIQLKSMRESTPKVAQQLIEVCAGREAADKRIKIIAVLAINLSPEDTSYLQQLSQDRSKKVITLAHHFLSRLGVVNVDAVSNEHAVELAAYYELKKAGIFKKTQRITPKKLQNKKQQAIRSELLTRIPLAQFAHVFNLKTDQLINAWVFDQNRYFDNIEFIKNAANSVSNEHITQLLDRLMENIVTDNNVISFTQPLFPRLTWQQKKYIALALLEHDDDITFFACLPCSDRPIPELNWLTIAKSIAWKNLQKQLTEELKDNGYVQKTQLIDELSALGLLVTCDVADHILRELVTLGLLQADPATNFLKFNAALSAYPNEKTKD